MNVKKVYKNKWISVLNEKNFYTFDENLNQVTVIPIFKNKILLVKQYRHALKKFTLEFPGGSVNKNENVKKSAARELYEETGIKINSTKKFKKLAKISVNPLRNRKIPNLFYVNLTSKDIPKKFKKNEEIEKCIIIDLKSFLLYCKKGQIISSFMISAFFLYVLKFRKFKLK